MQLSKIGEFGLIERFRKKIKTDSSVVVGSGDDCAVLKFDRKHYQLLTCDMIIEGIDFTLKDSPYLIGRKALAISISDIAACAGIARYAVISLGLPRNTKVGFIDKLFEGVRSVADEFKVNIVGGDISESDRLILDASILGVVEKNNLVLRSGARPKDIIFTTGSFGGSIIGKHFKFQPRLKESRYLVENFKINSMIDVSDGLVQDLGHIVEDSNVGGVLYEEQIPLSKDACNLEDALYSGEDFELIFTCSQKMAGKILSKKPSAFKAIGEILDKKQGFYLIDKTGRVKPFDKDGFRHFR